jgi:hypothetical protein
MRTRERDDADTTSLTETTTSKNNISFSTEVVG